MITPEQESRMARFRVQNPELVAEYERISKAISAAWLKLLQDETVSESTDRLED